MDVGSKIGWEVPPSVFEGWDFEVALNREDLLSSPRERVMKVMEEYGMNKKETEGRINHFADGGRV